MSFLTDRQGIIRHIYPAGQYAPGSKDYSEIKAKIEFRQNASSRWQVEGRRFEGRSHSLHEELDHFEPLFHEVPNVLGFNLLGGSIEDELVASSFRTQATMLVEMS